MDLEELLNPERLEANYKYLLNELSFNKKPSNNLLEILKNMPTTHTFAKEENWEFGKRFPYQDILFSDKAILSQSYRESNNKFQLGEPKMNLGYSKKLNNFVYAYLGIHDHFYSMTKSKKKDGKIPIPAFGAFIDKKMDNAEYSNVTVRDLTSPECYGYNQEDLFLKPENGRLITAYEIYNRHNNDFWKYWGSLDNFKNEKFYINENWQWKTEFHYLEKVEVKNFIALLWPIGKSQVYNFTSYINQIELREIKKFKNENPNVMVYKYKWELCDAFLRFVWASFIVSNYIYEFNTVPTEDYFNKLFSSQFS